MPLVDHISIGVSDLARSRRFYDAALGALDVVSAAETARSVSYQRGGEDDFSIHRLAPDQLPLSAPPQNHFAFRAPSRGAVDRFHSEALAAGGRDDGPPGLRPQYHPGYYAAFVLDPDGHRIEAVHHTR